MWGCGIPNLGTSLRLPGLSAGWEGAAAGQDGERHHGITQLPASSQGLGEAGLGWRLCPGSFSGCSHLGCPLHPRVAPLLFRMLPGFCGLTGPFGTERGPLAAGQGAGE